MYFVDGLILVYTADSTIIQKYIKKVTMFQLCGVETDPSAKSRARFII